MSQEISPVELSIKGGRKDLGGLFVTRVLPSLSRRAIGPFVFLDHMGPATFSPGHGIDVRPHPHINLATLTYLFKGEILHRDSLGSFQAIRPGAVNWMTAGRGIVHSERTSPELRRTGSTLDGIQLWIALPKAHEEEEPAFYHYPAESLPYFEERGASVRLLAGAAYGRQSPVRIFSSSFYIDVALSPKGEIVIPEGYEERAAYVADGVVWCGEQRFDSLHMIVFTPGQKATLRAEGPARLILLGGAPLDGPRHLWWNFVSSSLERIEKAKDDWKNGRFPKVPGDDIEFIPLPDK